MIITGSTVYNHFSHPCLYRIHLDLFGDRSRRSQPDAAGRYLMERGIRHEARVFAELKERFGDDYRTIERDPDLSSEDDIARRVEGTLQAMRDGVRCITHGFLTSEEGDFCTVYPGQGKEPSPFVFRGETDILERRDDLESAWGSYGYVVGDVKSSRHARLGQKMQVAFYSLILEKRQGLLPPSGFIVTGDSRREEFSIDDLKWSLSLFLEEEISTCIDSSDVAFHFSSRCRFCHWREHCRSKAEEQDDLSLIPGCRPTAKRALTAAGILNRQDLLRQEEADLRDLGRSFGSRLDGFRDLKKQAGAQEFGRAVMRQDPRTTVVRSSVAMGAPCIFRHRGPLLLVDAIPDRFFGDEALMGFALVRPLVGRDDEDISLSFEPAPTPGAYTSTLRSLFIALNDNNKLLKARREHALLVFVDSTLPRRLRRQSGSLWQQKGKAPVSVERLLSDSAVLTDVVERTYHLPIDAWELDKVHPLLDVHAGRENSADIWDRDALAAFATTHLNVTTEETDEALQALRGVLEDYGIDPEKARTDDGCDWDAILVREWRDTGRDGFCLLLKFRLARRLRKAKAIAGLMTRLVR